MTSKRGTVSFEVGGVSHKARLSTNAMIRFQDETGRSVLEAFKDMDGKSADLKGIRDLLWVSVEGDHTREDIGEIMDELGLVESGRIIGEIGRAAFPPAEGDATDPQAAEPGNPKAGKKAR